jgi:putative hydrolase of the HAD superfamily
LTQEDARRFWLESSWVRQFETGRCSPQAFASGIIDELQLAITPEEFLQEFCSWEKGPFPGALDLLESLKPRFLLVCLSNNNELHWQALCDHSELPGKFHHVYLSHEIGLMKPDQKIFEHVLADLDIQAGQMIFFDDNHECIETAQRLGIRAYHVQGIEEVSQVLLSLDIR